MFSISSVAKATMSAAVLSLLIVGCSAQSVSPSSTTQTSQQRRSSQQAIALERGALVNVTLPASLDPSHHTFALTHGTQVFKEELKSGAVAGAGVRRHYRLLFIKPGQPKPAELAQAMPGYVVP